VDALSPKPLDDLLAALADPHAIERKLRRCFGHAEEVAPGCVGVEAQEQVGGRQVEETQRV